MAWHGFVPIFILEMMKFYALEIKWMTSIAGERFAKTFSELIIRGGKFFLNVRRLLVEGRHIVSIDFMNKLDRGTLGGHRIFSL